MSLVHKSFGRSKTRQQLPNIRVKMPKIIHSNSYLGQVTQQLSGNVQYDEMDHSSLTKQKQRLKDILIKINDDTYKIISGMTTRCRRVQSHQRTATATLAINEQQVQNNYKVIEQCLCQIEKLKVRLQELSNHNKQFFDQAIVSISNEIEFSKEENRFLRVLNEKVGKNIVQKCEQALQNEIRYVEMDVYLAEHKVSHLRARDEQVIQQIDDLKKRLKQIQPKWVQAQKYMKGLEAKNQQQANEKNNEQQVMQKRAKMAVVQKKIQFYNQNCQYKYYKLLKDLEQSSNSLQQIDGKISKTNSQNQKSKTIISELQTKLKQMKQRRKLREESINQFITKSRIKSQPNKQQDKTPKKWLKKNETQMKRKAEPQKQHDNEFSGSSSDFQRGIKFSNKQQTKNYNTLDYKPY